MRVPSELRETHGPAHLGLLVLVESRSVEAGEIRRFRITASAGVEPPVFVEMPLEDLNDFSA